MAVLPGGAPRTAVAETAEALPPAQRTGFLVDVGIVAAAAEANPDSLDASSLSAQAAAATARR